MALARIITRSNPCSRQLALDLLGRGYAVEIVSPDSIPDNLADLELRVEEDPGNQLVASVEAHNGGRSTALPTTARPRCASPRHDRAGWSWRVSLALASVVLMAMVLAFGMRQTGKASSQSSGSSPAENVAGASTEMNLMSAMVPKAEAKENPMSPPAAKSEHNSDHTPKEPQVATGGATTSGDTTAGTTTAGSGDGPAQARGQVDRARHRHLFRPAYLQCNDI